MGFLKRNKNIVGLSSVRPSKKFFFFHSRKRGNVGNGFVESSWSLAEGCNGLVHLYANLEVRYDDLLTDIVERETRLETGSK